MMQTLFDLLRERGYRQTSLSVQKDNPAVRFYERLGYEITGERRDHANHEDFLMMKNLKI
jgi:ribosomal protein S18 acetylase RimI-like enzyme